MIRTNGNRVALYARFSSDNQRSESIDAQLRAMETYCKQNNYIIVEKYIDEAKSATTDRRPSFQKLISDSSLKIFDIVLVHKLDRFARNRYDSAVYKRELKKNGVAVHSVLENIDNSPESIMLEAVLEGMNEYYSQNLARETMKGMRETALQGKHVGGIPPLGYTVDPESRKLIINEEEAEIVRLIYSMYADGYGYGEILDVLHEKRYLTKRKREFVKNSLHSILENPKYQGKYVFNRRSSKDASGHRNNHKMKDADDVIVIEGGCPRIVDQKTFNRVQARLGNNKCDSKGNKAKEKYILTGTLFCKECGRAMYGNVRPAGREGKKFCTYRCPSRKHNCNNREINKEYLDVYVVSLIKQEMLTSRAFKKLKKKIQTKALEDVEGVDYEQQELIARLDGINETLKKVTDSVLASGIVSDALAERLRELEEEKAKLEIELKIIDAKIKYRTIDPESLLSEYADVKDAPNSPPYRRFIRSLIKRIDIGRYNVEIVLKTGLDLYPCLDTTYTVSRQEIYEKGKVLT